jgi:glycosyltransferase involved in cell wall biosynthesis
VALAYTAHFLEGVRLRNGFFPMRRVFQETRPDMVVVAQCEMATLCFMSMAFTAGCPYFVTHLHGNAKVERASSLTSRLTFAIYDLFVAPRVAASFAVSAALANYARGAIGRKRPVYFVPNPVRSFVVASPFTADPPRYLSVARLTYQKGQDTLLRAFSLVIKRLPDAHLDLVGAGPDEAGLKSLAFELGIAPNVAFHGHQLDPGPFLRKANCFVLASRWEGFAVALAEALSCGLPVVTTDCDFGPRDLVPDARVGRVVKVDDVEALAAAMIEVATTVYTADDVAHRISIVRQFATPIAAAAHFEAIRAVVSPNLGPRRSPEFARSAADSA